MHVRAGRRMSVARNYFLKTDRLGFGHWRVDDLTLAMMLWSEARVTAYFGGPFSQEAVRARLDREIESMHSNRIQYWPVFSLADDELAGCAGLRPRERDRGIVELGVHLRPLYWGQGLAREAGAAVIEYAFEMANVRGVFAGHHPENLASRKMIEGLGFRYTHDEWYGPTGVEHMCYLLMRAQDGKARGGE